MAKKKPNILFIMGDDIGITNLSCYSQGLMGYKTPNIDSIAKDGILFTDFYGEQSCTAGRAAFATGQSPYRSGLTKVGLPGADLGIPEGTVTLAWALKELGYRTGQFGKNHFGDLPKYYPTRHGFDEFFGVFYHLNAYEEPEHRDYPSEQDFPHFHKKYGPRNLTYTWVDGREEDRGALTTERMKTVDGEFQSATKDFIKRAVDADEPFFVWHNTTHMHYYTHTRPEDVGRSGRWQSSYHDTMLYHDDQIGDLLNYLKELGIDDDTIVVYTTDNGPHMNTWPDGAMTPFRNEKNSNWEGAYRIPCLAKYPAKWPKGQVLNGICSLMDWFPTLCTQAGDTDVSQRLLKGSSLGGQVFKAHIDGVDQSNYFAGETNKSARDVFIYVTDNGDVCGLRYDNWKFVFLAQAVDGSFAVWFMPMVELNIPLIFNLRTDPFERAQITSNTYFEWASRHEFLVIPAIQQVAQWAATFQEFPPTQEPSSFTINKVMEKLAQTRNN